MTVFSFGQDVQMVPVVSATAAGMSPFPSGSGAPQVYVDAGNEVGDAVGVLVDVNPNPAVVVETFPAALAEQSSGGFDWFEDFHVIPRAIDLGNLLSNQSVAIEVYSAFRRTTHSWDTFVNGAGAGVTLTGMPTLPINIAPQEGLQMVVDVSTIGVPFVDDTLDFGFDIGTISVPITITRIVLWWPRPEFEPVERLRFKTDVMRAHAGSERRRRLRKNPRQAFDYRYRVEDGEVERQPLENLLFDWQGRVFGVPVWFEETELTAAATAGAFSVNVTQTAYRDFRIGGLAVVLTAPNTADVLTIDSMTATSLTFETALANSYAAGAVVVPLRTCHASKSLAGERQIINLSGFAIGFDALDNDVAIASTAAFATYKSKVLIDSDTVVRGGAFRESFDLRITNVDNETGVPLHVPIDDRHRHSHPYTFRAEGRQAVWELRQLMHSIGGRQISFYVVESASNLKPIQNLLNASNQLEVANVGYTQFVRNRQPKNEIRVSFVSGSTPLLRTITGSAIVDATHETLTVNTNWPSTITPAQISRIEYVEKVRFDTDEIVLNYDKNGAVCRITAPLVAVFE